MADATFRAFAGIRNTLPAERLAPEDLTAAVNVDIDDSGRVARRAGTTVKVAGAAHSLWADGADCFYMQGNSLMRLLPDFSSVSMATGLTLDLPTSYVTANGRVYWTNGRQSGVIVDGSNRRWGLPTPAAPGLAAIDGSLSAGTYQLVLTHLRHDGFESGAGMAVAIALGDNAGVRVSWPQPTNPNVTGIAVYMSEPNGETLYQVGVFPASDDAAEIVGGSLALPLNTQWYDQPPAGQCLTLHRGRLFIAVGAVLYATTALGNEYVDLRDYLAIDDSTITFIAGVEHGLFIGTEQKVYFLAGDRLEELSLTVVVDGAGVARSAIQADGLAASGNVALAGQQVVLFATELGVCQGNPDGSIVNLTHARYQFAATPAGAALFRSSDVLHQYLLFMS